MRPHGFISLAALALGFATPAYAQDPQPEAPAPGEEADTSDDGLNEIVVVAQQLRGQVQAPEPPIVELDEEQVASYGAGSLADLVEALAPQTGSGRGRGSGSPAFLVNGVRVSSFRELRSYPPEAIRRVEVLPETVAQRYGFSPDQRVINFILKDNYSSWEIELEYGQPLKGGYSTKEIEGTLLRIAGPSRLNLNLELGDSSLLTEAERGVIQSSGIPSVITDPDPAAYRSLVADTEDYELTANWTRSLGESGTSLTLNGTVERNDSLSLSGLDVVLLIDPAGVTAVRSFDDPLERWLRTDTLAAGATLNTYAGDWQLTGTLDASHARLENRIDRRAEADFTDRLVLDAAAGLFDVTGDLPDLPAAGFDTAISKTDNATFKVTAIGRPITLPAGEISTTLDAGYDWSRIQSEDTRNDGMETDLTRGNLNAGITVGVPLTSRREDIWPFLGDFTLNLTAGVNHLSDFGTLTNWSGGFTWGISERLNLQASYIVRGAAPSLTQLGAPEIVILNTPIYDFITGQTVLASVISGGNPDLEQEKQHDLRLAAFWDVPWFQRSNLLLEYFRNESEDVSASFPLLTPAIEAAFPDRVTRSGSGRLLAIDQRPVTFAKQESSRIRFGVNLAGQIGKTPDEPTDGGSAARSGGRDRSGSGGREGAQRSRFLPGRGGPGGDGVGRWNLSLTHSVELDNQVLVAPGGPLLDLLDGDALSGGGVSRHTLTLEGGAFYKGFGVRVAGNYRSGSDVDGTGLPGSSDLRFGPLATFNLRVFADLGRQESLVEAVPFFKDARATIRINNVFDARRKVTNESGEVPLSYQPYLIDPVGRFIEVELRKLF